MISSDIINSLNNNSLNVLNLRFHQIINIDDLKCLENNSSLTELDLSCNLIDNIEVLKCLENNHSLNELFLYNNKINKNDIENIFNKVLEKNYSLISLEY